MQYQSKAFNLGPYSVACSICGQVIQTTSIITTCILKPFHQNLESVLSLADTLSQPGDNVICSAGSCHPDSKNPSDIRFTSRKKTIFDTQSHQAQVHKLSRKRVSSNPDLLFDQTLATNSALVTAKYEGRYIGNRESTQYYTYDS